LEETHCSKELKTAEQRAVFLRDSTEEFSVENGAKVTVRYNQERVFVK
jgi:hypothetical protein